MRKDRGLCIVTSKQSACGQEGAVASRSWAHKCYKGTRLRPNMRAHATDYTSRWDTGLRQPYLLRTSRMSRNAACRERVLSWGPSAWTAVGAPLGAFARGLASLRFAAEGDAGAGGSVGGVRVPLAAAMVLAGCCWRCASDGVGWNALRAAGGVVSRSSSLAFPRRDTAMRDGEAEKSSRDKAQAEERWLAATRKGAAMGGGWC